MQASEGFGDEGFGHEGLRDQIMQNLKAAIERLNDDYERVAFWAAALDAFVKPIPPYETTYSEHLLRPLHRPPNNA